MARTLRLALAQINPTVGDIAGNTAKILEYLERAREAQADLVAFPEMATTGYPPEDLLFKTSFLTENVGAMEKIAAAAKGITAVIGYVNILSHDRGPEDMGIPIANAAALAHDGRVVDTYHKIFLPNYGVFDEQRYFQRGSVCPVYRVEGVSIGVNICEDIWYPVGPTTVQCRAGAELIVNINASPFQAGKRAFREDMIAQRAVDHGLTVAYVNTVGGQDELVFDGGSIIYDSAGELLARGPSFEEALIVTDLEFQDAPASRKQGPAGVTSAAVAAVGTPKAMTVSGPGTASKTPLPGKTIADAINGPEEVYRALVMGTGDYLRKSGFSKALVGLSGGVDSALTAVVAVDALGKENVVGITMPSRYSSQGSIGDSETLAKNLGMELWEVPIEPAHRAFEDMLKDRFKATDPNVAEENVQARVRGNVLMTVSNKFGWIVLTTGNKSEMAMGYATLYGDMAGGFAVLKDVPKTKVYELCRWRNGQGQAFGTRDGVIPASIIDKPPSAELRDDQLDSDSLPPYEVLDPVVQAYVEDDLSYQDMVDQGMDPQVVRQVMAAVDRNEYKRRQAAPGVKITHRAFGKDRRLPIVNRYRQHSGG
ncbi:MAG: NAD+ synthase [Chloroflexi bacterium]|nr:NAD+ synthase [Chloroflexota bacterium]MDA1270708.1 NAD+ synthase [Chloroflexota bacterium]PKB59565.1 MAG: NAD+ synthase [SAR202 cluster bacterium Casp-Chloro-G2]